MQQPWSFASEGNNVLATYEGTTIRIPRAQALQFGAGLTSYCAGGVTSQSRTVAAPAAPTPQPSGRTKTKTARKSSR